MRGAQTAARFCAAALILATIAAPAAAQGIQDPNVLSPAGREALARAKVLWDRDQHEAALAELNRAVQSDPNAVEPYKRRAFVLAQLGRKEAALNDYKLLMARFPNAPDLTSERGTMLLDFGMYDEAYKDFARLAQLVPRSSAARLNMGLALKELGRLEEALVKFDEAVDLAPSELGPRVERALIFYRQGRQRDAELEIVRAQEVSRARLPDYYPPQIEKAKAEQGTKRPAPPRVGSAEAAVKAGREKLAVREFRPAIALFEVALAADRNNVPALIGRGGALREVYQLVLAMEDVEKAIALDAKQPEAYLWRARIHKDYGQADAALADYGVVLRLDAKFAPAYSDRGRFLASRNLPKEAMADLNRAIELNPKDFLALVWRAQIRALDYADPGALDDYNRAVALKPDDAKTLCNRGLWLWTLNSKDEGKRDLRACTKMDPTLRHFYLVQIDMLESAADFAIFLRSAAMSGALEHCDATQPKGSPMHLACRGRVSQQMMALHRQQWDAYNRIKKRQQIEWF
jgi:tetratricopeptide (TPR) repeat protein